MPKANLGYYGGPNCRFIQHPQGVRGYYQTVCCLCPKKAIYHCGGDGYCRNHKSEAVKRFQKRNNYLDIKATSFEDILDTQDDIQRKHEHLRLVKKRNT